MDRHEITSKCVILFLFDPTEVLTSSGFYSTRYMRDFTLFLRIRRDALPPWSTSEWRARPNALLGPVTAFAHPICVWKPCRRDELGGDLSLGCVCILVYYILSSRNDLMDRWLTLRFSVKTKTQQRALSGERYRGPFETLHRLLRGMFQILLHYPVPTLRSGPEHAPRTLLAGYRRLYRGLGVSAVRSVTTHGLLWTILDYVSGWIDRRQIRCGEPVPYPT
jgi:hypothetical protein